MGLEGIQTLDDYLTTYGSTLGRKAMAALKPLHTPKVDDIPFNWSEPHPAGEFLRTPFEPQAHVIQAASRMMDEVGNGFIVGEMGTGKTLLGMCAAHIHAKGKPYRGVVVCPDHLIDKWVREIKTTIPNAQVFQFGVDDEAKPDDEPKRGKGRKKKGVRKSSSRITRTLTDLVKLISNSSSGVKVVPGEIGAGVVTEEPVSTGPDSFDMVNPKANPNSGKVVHRSVKWHRPIGAEWYVIGRNQAKWDPRKMSIGDEHHGYESVEGLAAGMSRYIKTGEKTTELVHEKPDAWTGPIVSGRSSKAVIVAREAKKDERGKEVFDERGHKVMVPVVDRIIFCPTCGNPVVGKDGTSVSADALKKRVKNSNAAPPSCTGLYLQEIHDPEDKSEKKHNFERIYSVVEQEYNYKHGGYRGSKSLTVAQKWTDAKPGKLVRWNKKLYEVRRCGGGRKAKDEGSPLWQWTGTPKRWAPSRFIQKKLKRAFRYLLVDEVHEHKSDESARANAAGKLMASVDHVLALTGTIIGGYANHMFPILIRMVPETVIGEGFTWGKSMPFSQAYGKVERVVTTKIGEEAPVSRGRGRNSMRKCVTGGKSTQDEYVKPGVMPTMYGRHMIGISMFITLKEMEDQLPGLHEYVGGPVPPPPSAPEPTGDYEKDLDAREKYEAELALWSHYKKFHVDTACDMDSEVDAEYRRVSGALEDASAELLQRGSMKLLGASNTTRLGYPDHPYGWVPEWPDELAVGYYKEPGDKNKTKENWIGVVQPEDLSTEVIRPKEQKLIEICKLNKAAGNQCWVYCMMTKKREVMSRLQRLLQAEGLKVTVLHDNTCKPEEREAWITANGKEADVIISNPTLVSTGLDLFSKEEGGHNFNTIIFYQTGYNLFDLRQASRRAWRISQPKECQVYYLYYKGTAQNDQMCLMSRKMSAALALEGEFSTEGLVAMTGEDNAQMALASRISGKIDPKDIQRNWGKLSSGVAKKKRRASQALVDQNVIDVMFEESNIPKPGEPSPFDDLPEPVQTYAASLVDDDRYGGIDEFLMDDDIPVPKTPAPAGTPKAKLSADEVAKLIADLADLGLDMEDML